MLLFLLPHARAFRTRLEQASTRRWAPQTLDLGDRNVHVRVSAPPRHGTPQLVFSTPISRLPALQIRQPTWLDRLGRRFGLAREAGSGDGAFDRRATVSCDYRELATLLLREPATRDAILALFDAGACALRFDDGELSAFFEASGDPGALRQRMHERAELLAALARQPMSIIGALTPMTPLWRLRRMSLLVGGVLLPLAAIGACVVFLDRYAPLDLPALVFDALKQAPLWWLGALIPALVWLRGHPDSARLLPVALLASGVAAAPAAIALKLARNGGDAADARDAVLDVTGSVRLSGPQAPTLRWSSTELQRRDLFGAPRSLSTQVSEAQWQATPIAHARLHARIAPGALGYPWLVSVAAISVAEDDRIVADPTQTPATTETDIAGVALQLSDQLSWPDESGGGLLAQATALFSDGKLLMAGQRLDQALAQLAREAAPPATRADAYWHRAMLFEKLGAPFEAQREADARAALALAPGHRGATALLDDILISRRSYGEALRLWEAVLAHQPGYPFGHYKRAQLLAATGALVEARSEAQASCRLGERAACDLAESF